MIQIGTSGFSYRDWLGRFYPPGLRERDWLAFYAREFSTVELNVTFYRMPSAAAVAAWIEHTPAGFVFAVKAFRGLTHERQAPDFAGFAASLRPLAEAGKLACVLAQFLQSFRRTPHNEAYLLRLREGLGDHGPRSVAKWGLPVAVEFRHAEWVSEDVYERLRQLRLGLACVDEPPLRGRMPPIAVATGPVAYVRLHGRNAPKWHQHEQAWRRYDYLYSDEELREWIARLRKLEAEAEQTLVDFNNTPRAQAVENARELMAAYRSLTGHGQTLGDGSGAD